VAPFPKLPTIIPTPPEGPTFDPQEYQKLVATTLAPGQAELDALQASIDELRALTKVAELDVPNWVSDLDEADLAISAFDTLDWGSPEPDLDTPTAYLAAQHNASVALANGITGPPPLSLLQPSGGAVVVLGGPPSQGGVAHAGSPPYTYHLQLFTVRADIVNVDADGGNGPNPPFASFGPVVKETAPDGKLWWVYLIQINPQTPGTYTAQAQYLSHGTFFGITGNLRSTKVFQVVIQ
jgi:hypothetical protein